MGATTPSRSRYAYRSLRLTHHQLQSRVAYFLAAYSVLSLRTSSQPWPPPQEHRAKGTPPTGSRAPPVSVDTTYGGGHCRPGANVSCIRIMDMYGYLRDLRWASATSLRRLTVTHPNTMYKLLNYGHSCHTVT